MSGDGGGFHGSKYVAYKYKDSEDRKMSQVFTIPSSNSVFNIQYKLMCYS